MAFQRPFVISLKRSDSRYPWGFQVFGGKDYGAPHVVQSVSEDSLAEQCGLRQGDEVIQVGRINTQDLSLAQLQELLIRCGNKIEMFVIREDLLTPRKGKEPNVVKAVVHNPYNSPLQLYSTENIADTLARQTEVLTEGQISADEDEGPENLSFKQKSEVFKLLEEQSRQESPPLNYPRSSPQSLPVKKPTAAPPPPPPKPKPPPAEHLYNGVDSHHHQTNQQVQQKRVEFQSTTEKVVNQYHYQEPTQQTRTYQVSGQPSQQQHQSYQGNYQQESYQNYQPLNQGNYQPNQGNQSPTPYQQQQHIQYQQSQGYHSPTNFQQSQGHQSPNYQQSQSHQPPNYQQSQSYQSQKQGIQSPPATYQQSQGSQQQQQYQSQQSLSLKSQSPSRKQQKTPVAVSNTEFKIGPPPPPRNPSNQHQKNDNMTAIYRQQYEQHLQQQYQQQQQYYQANNYDEGAKKPTTHLITDNIFENNTSSGTPITYKAPPAAPSKPAWPPTSPQQDGHHEREVTPSSPSYGLKNNITSVWPPKQPSVRELPRTGFNPAAVREQGTGRRCVWPPPKDDEAHNGRNTPQSPATGRKINWNPSPSPPPNRRNVFGTSHSPARRKDIAWPPPSPQTNTFREGPTHRSSPRLSRKARFDDYIKEHASNNIPTAYRAPPGTQHVEYC